MKYKNLFFDLDDTLWAFSVNAQETFEEIYDNLDLKRFFDSFKQFYSIYQKRNMELWKSYEVGGITKDELNHQRFRYPLDSVGVDDSVLAGKIRDEFFSIIATKKRLMPYAREILETLAPRFHLYILSNGFRELQCKKMCSAGIDGYFEKTILSDDIGMNKPKPEIFYFALSATQSELRDSLLIGDSWKADMVGAKEVGMDQTFYNVADLKDFPFRPTFVIDDLRELVEILEK
ncbi:MAG: YjjG family noncanonical pyrimidine nucleotidase [Bacteroidaceae bacterium]|nr:YjjG family noncanonical pyrimidine nucleotidase [Bacteroidaceae bacterium]